MYHLSLRVKLISAFAVATLLTLGIGIFGVVNQRALVNTSEFIVNVEFPKINHVSEMRRMVREALGLFLQVNMVGNDEKEIERIKAKILKTFGDTEAELKAIQESSDDPEEAKMITDMVSTYNLVKSQAIGMLDTAGRADYSSHEKMGDFYRGEFKKNRFALYDSYDALYKLYKAEADATVAQAKKDSNRSILITLFSILLGSLCVMFFGIWFAIHLSRHLTHASFTLSNETNHVDSSSQELLEISQNLAQSMNSQASAVQQTAASVEEISSMIYKSAESAKASTDISNETRERAMEGRRLASEVVNSMEKIHQSNEDITRYVNESNQELSKIVTVIGEIESKTKVINDIVFQTKLLSFNASVEAARAGENGKGFAVVAEEVGNLAQMSGAAAKEISAILKSSLDTVSQIVSSTRQNVESLMKSGKEKVELGLRSAQRSDEVLNELALKMDNMNQMIEEITLASKEQSQGVEEISKAISQFEKVTNDNVQTSRVVSEASHRLKNNAEEMKDLANDLTTTVEGRAA